MSVRESSAVRSPLAVLVALALLGASVPAAAERPLEARCRSEIVELHRFLEAWSNAELPATDEAFFRFERALAPSFWLIGPDGEQAGREPIVAAIRAARGRWQGGRIRIENVRLHQAAAGLALATYEEWHEVDGETTGRLSTVLFGSDDAAPNGLVWLHLHEVWIAADDGP